MDKYWKRAIAFPFSKTDWENDLGLTFPWGRCSGLDILNAHKNANYENDFEVYVDIEMNQLFLTDTDKQRF